MASRTERFERKANAEPKPVEEEKEEEILHFPPDEEAALLHESNELKRLANNSFAAGEYQNAVTIYNTALDTCPKYLHYDRAILKSNVAACYIKTNEWTEAAKAAGECLDFLGLAEGKKKKKARRSGENREDADEEKEKAEAEQQQDEEADEEIVSAGAARAEDTSAAAQRKRDLDRIRAKALMRRGKARMETASWSSLTGAEEDYKQLSSMSDVSAADMTVVRRALAELPGRVKMAQEKEMGEMMGKLKELGNGILKPFGLSTDSFNMVKDDKTGGYSLNFNQGGK